MSHYEYLQLSYANDLNRVQVPKYQRGLVWTKEKKNNLIETLHKGFPFGVLLVAENDDSHRTLQLLDGQQRLATIKDYQQNKVGYWMELNVESSNELLDKINSIIRNDSDTVTEQQLEKLLNPDYELADWTDDLDNISKTTRKELRDLITETRKQINDYINLDTLMIPVIKFQGATADLPEVFENLNKGGTPLSKYEVFNAAWINDRLTLPVGSENADEILKNVKDYYIGMGQDGKFEVSDFSEDELSDSREISVAEFARALGRFVLTRIPALMNDTDKNRNEVGFGLLGIISGVDNKKIAEVHTKFDQIQKGLEGTLESVSRISNQLNETFDKILKQQISHSKKAKAKKQVYSNALTSTFKLLSYFASLWSLDEEDTQQTLRNLPGYYVSDYVAGLWNAHGDQRLSDYYPDIRNKNYMNPVNQEKFRTAFVRWADENTGIRKTFSRDLQALITIHSNLTYLALDIPHGEDYEYEHIIPKKRVLDSDPTPAKVHLSSLGNGMLLPKSDNNHKKDNTLYEADDSGKYDQLIRLSSYPSKESFETSFNALKEQDFDTVNVQIENRANNVISAIISGLLTN
ncbi:DUF262 domain-containing protein [Lacticaseibacillus pabuli]|uniref:DUF262 domain-containing protein n=1 Tax=Lacticaseibacillus pabuli TaxID=3025672 RepID=A0ABY7WV97_9LACO|nr:DUF262 domain-containing protein [Lacticaseibacillus sp. KACC 23028]WDF82926.1 DUF262 domain-containing protein [Lacticaseibacillus sp. KACC 23028]